MRPWVALFALLTATQANADQTIFGPTRNGVQIVCADVNDLGVTTSDLIGTWILGFWSGLNAAKNARVGDATTGSGVVGEVKLYCSSHPSVSLPQATLDTYAAIRGLQSR
jgi:hypothetical protein